MNLREIKKLLKRYQIFPSKRLGQNFLISKSVLLKVIRTADLSKKEIVLEIGPGIGNLTIELAKRAKKVIAVEKDKRMSQILRDVLREKKIENVKIIHQDILKVSFKKESSSLLEKSYKIVANIPYYLTSPLIRKFLECPLPPSQMILMVQKELAQRICARPPKMNLLAVSVQFYARPEIISFVSKRSFWPQPRVDSAIIKISNLKTKTSGLDKNLFFKIVRAGFSHPRKKLVNNLSFGLKLKKERAREWILKSRIDPNQRGENLEIKEWILLTKNFE